MQILWFFFGLLLGLLLLWWQQRRSQAKMRFLLRKLQTSAYESALPSESQLSLAIADQQRIQQKLEQQIDIYQQILQVAPTGYLQVDDENRLLWCNELAQQILQIPQERYVPPRLLLELVRSYELDQLIEQTRQTEKRRDRDWTFFPVSPDASQPQVEYPLRGYGIPLPDGQVGIFLENRLEAATLMQQRDRWASDVAHELKTPLTSIRLVAETLQTRVHPSMRGWIDRLVNETIRLGNLVQDLLDLSQLDQGLPHRLNLKQVDLVELIEAAWLNLEPLASKKHLQLAYCGVDALVLAIDEPRMFRVLINLLDNSIKYSPPRQTIQVKLNLQTDNHQACAHLEVIDAGLGIAEADLPHIFERFYRADPARARSPDSSNASTEPQHRSSSGLGLAIVQQIIEAHAGKVTADNHPETGGAWLQVWLPIESGVRS
ncbi:PAS domain-containing protein [Microcoleus sp. FACHB-1515]|uniref:sensor histidine kinase n=1 Tax=Cyanophyceae TaxID=3028117 RepID=UPI001688DD0B|nr:ATP-binding protein [Microcoleus sp. FACHB-1515]MBD2088388.1 PAS domain-containing protein [Microcoleus sp. FACHB-1515]